MHYDPLPHNIEKDIERIANQQHITPTEALLKVVETGLISFPSNGKRSSIGTSNALVSDALRKVDLIRADRAKELASLSKKNDGAMSLIGILKDEPEIVEAIRQAGRDQRQALNR